MGRIEDRIGIFLEREDIAVFSTTYALPHHDGLLRIDSSCTVVADHATKHSVVRSRDVVVFIDGKRCQRRSLNTEDLGTVHIRNHGRIQRMDSFHDEDILLMELHHIALEEFASFLEIEARDFHFLTGKKVIELLS